MSNYRQMWSDLGLDSLLSILGGAYQDAGQLKTRIEAFQERIEAR